jgi:hypothetical protein
MSKVAGRLHLEESEHRSFTAHADAEQVVAGAELPGRVSKPDVTELLGVLIRAPVVVDRIPGDANGSREHAAVRLRWYVAGPTDKPPTSGHRCRFKLTAITTDGDGVIARTTRSGEPG